MKKIRVLITEKCNANCINCFNSSERSNKEISVDDFVQLAQYLSANKIDELKIMGGEPTVHSKFEEIIIVSRNYFKKVHLFTNALNNKIFEYIPFNGESIIYNFLFIDENFDLNKLILDKEGNRILEIQIGSTTDINLLRNRLLNIIHLKSESIYYSITLDCMENIFEKRKIILNNLFKIITFLNDNNLSNKIRMDHRIPLCFLYGTETQLLPKQGICSVHCAGLIDSSLNLRYCNQFNKILINLKYNDQFIPFKILENHLQLGIREKEMINLNKICKNCIFWGVCNGGCFLHKDNISNEDILKYSTLPKTSK